MDTIKITVPQAPSLKITPPGGVTNHASLSSLDYESSGHTGFQKELSEEELSNLKAIPQKANVSDIYYRGTIDALLGDKADKSELVGKKGKYTGVEIFNDYENNDTNIPHAHIEGHDNKAILKCFLITQQNGSVVTLNSVEGISVGMRWNIFVKPSSNPNPRYRGVVKSINGNTVDLNNAELPDFTPSSTGTLFNTLIVEGGTVGPVIIQDNVNAVFSTHIEGSGCVGYINSHAEGMSNQSLGYASHAEGQKTTSTGDTSHSEGYNTRALGHNSHAEGHNTETQLDCAHAEGSNTYAGGQASHAEGQGTSATGNHAHSEGLETEANGYVSHAEGRKCMANGPSTHAEGYSTVANGQSSHAEGQGTTADGTYTHAEGLNTFSSGRASHSEGEGTVSSGRGAHAEGRSCTASGNQSHAEGLGCIASGEESHAEGWYTEARGKYQHTQGKFNVIDENNEFAHIVGGGTSDTNRKNIHTLDWNGNGWFAGGLTIGNDKKKVMTKDEVYTKDEVDNIVDNLGGSSAQWKKLSDQTVEENAVNAVSTESTELTKCKEFIIRVVFPKTETVETMGTMRIFVNNTVVYRANSVSTTTSGLAETRCHLILADGFVYTVGTENSRGHANIVGNAMILVGNATVDTPQQIMAMLDASKPFSIGTKFEVYGKVES